MGSDFLYMLGVVAVGWAITIGMRALPFLVFAGHKREIPPQVERFGALVSPVIIAALIVYSYSGLQWRTAWPYLAGVLTVAVHLWKGSPLASITAGTVFYMCLASCGCMTAESEMEYGMAHPLIQMTEKGMKFQDRYVTPQQAIKELERRRVPHDATIHILVDDENAYRRASLVFRGMLAKAGYTRSVLITEKRASSSSAIQPATPTPPHVDGSRQKQAVRALPAQR